MMTTSTQQIIDYIYGDLTQEEQKRIRDLASEDSEVAAMIAVLRNVIPSDVDHISDVAPAALHHSKAGRLNRRLLLAGVLLIGAFVATAWNWKTGSTNEPAELLIATMPVCSTVRTNNTHGQTTILANRLNDFSFENSKDAFYSIEVGFTKQAQVCVLICTASDFTWLPLNKPSFSINGDSNGRHNLAIIPAPAEKQLVVTIAAPDNVGPMLSKSIETPTLDASTLLSGVRSVLKKSELEWFAVSHFFVSPAETVAAMSADPSRAVSDPGTSTELLSSPHIEELDLLIRSDEYRQARERIEQLQAVSATKLERCDLLRYRSIVENRIGEPDVALQLAQESIDIAECCYSSDRFPDGHERLAACLGQLGRVLSDAHQLSEARGVLERALHMRRLLEPKPSVGNDQIAESLSAVGYLMAVQREYGAAEEMMKQSFEMYAAIEDVIPNEDRKNEMARLLNARGQIARFRRDIKTALSHHLHAQKIQATIDPPLSDRLKTIESIAIIRFFQKDYVNAVAGQKQVVQQLRKLSDETGGSHPNLIDSLNTLGLMYSRFNKPDESTLAYKESLELSRKILGESVRGLRLLEQAATLSNLGLNALQSLNYKSAFDHLAESSRIERTVLPPSFAESSEAECLNMAAKNLRPCHLLLSAARELPESWVDAYREVWNRKGLIQEIVSNRMKLMYQIEDPEVGKLVARYRNLSEKHSIKYRDAGRHQWESLEKLANQKEALEREISARIPSPLGKLSVDPIELMQAIPLDSAFVDIYRFNHFTWGKERANRQRPFLAYYVIFVLSRHGTMHAEFVPADPIDEAIAAWHSSTDAELSEASLKKLGTLLWQTIESHLHDEVRHVLISPDSVTRQIPWAALPIANGDQSVVDRYVLSQIPDGRALLADLHEGPHNSKVDSALIVGAVDYNSVVSDKGDQPPVVVSIDPSLRSSFTALPHTKAEIESARMHLPTKTTVLSGDKATTRAVGKALTEHDIIHLATHAVYVDSSSSALYRFNAANRAWVRSTTYQRHRPGDRIPLAQCALALSGAARPQGTDVENSNANNQGILSGEACAASNLSRARLVVLSACATGLGEETVVAGTYSLVRAFHVGGAQNVIGSIMEVDDKTTSLLMSSFYRHLSTDAAIPSEALAHAQRELRDKLTASGVVNNQRFWATWICSGLPKRITF